MKIRIYSSPYYQNHFVLIKFDHRPNFPHKYHTTLTYVNIVNLSSHHISNKKRSGNVVQFTLPLYYIHNHLFYDLISINETTKSAYSCPKGNSYSTWILFLIAFSASWVIGLKPSFSYCSFQIPIPRFCHAGSLSKFMPPAHFYLLCEASNNSVNSKNFCVHPPASKGNNLLIWSSDCSYTRICLSNSSNIITLTSIHQSYIHFQIYLQNKAYQSLQNNLEFQAC